MDAFKDLRKTHLFTIKSHMREHIAENLSYIGTLYCLRVSPT